MCQTWTRLNGATNQIPSGEGTFVGSISETSLSFSSPFFVDLSVTLIIQHPLTSSSGRRRKNRLVPHPPFCEPPKKQIRYFACKNERSSKRKGNTLSKDVLFR